MDDATPTVPPRAAPDPVASIFADQQATIERLVDAVEASARETVHARREIASAIRVFAEQHGERAAAEAATAGELRKLHGSVDILVGEVRRALARLAPLELEVEHLRNEVRELRDDKDTEEQNGNGNGHG